MKGSIRERSPSHWAIILDQRDTATGKRKRKWHTFLALSAKRKLNAPG